MYPDRRNAWLIGPMFFVIIVAFISEYHEALLLWLWVINPTRPATITAVSKATRAMAGIQINRREYVKVQTPRLGVPVILIPVGARREVKVKIQRKVQIDIITFDKACRGAARTRMRNSHELHGMAMAARYSPVSTKAASWHGVWTCIWQTKSGLGSTTWLWNPVVM